MAELTRESTARSMLPDLILHDFDFQPRTDVTSQF